MKFHDFKIFLRSYLQNRSKSPLLYFFGVSQAIPKFFYKIYCVKWMQPMERSGTQYFFHLFWAELADESGLEFKMWQSKLGAVHKGRPQIFPYFWPLPPSCLQPSAFQGPLPKKDVCKSGIWPPPPLHFHVHNMDLFGFNFEWILTIYCRILWFLSHFSKKASLWWYIRSETWSVYLSSISIPTKYHYTDNYT